MKVGTDAVLIGAWAGHPAPSHILDIGTGSGLIALMMAQRFGKSHIVGIDIHQASAIQAGENFKHSDWSQRLDARNISLQEYAQQADKKYDLIVSNPPFFNDSLLPPDSKKALAKHTRALSFKEMANCVSILLAEDGNFTLILPVLDQLHFEQEASQTGLYKKRELIITPVTGKSPNRIISEWSLVRQKTQSRHLTIRKNQNNYTEAYIRLTGEFYLAL